MKINQLKAGTILSYVQMALGVIIGLLYTPVMIRLLGKSEYGLYNTVASTISMMSVLSLGFNASYVRFYSKYKKEDAYCSIYKLNGFFLAIYCIIALIVLLCGFFLANNLTLVFEEGLTQKEYAIAKVLMALLTFNLAISFPMSIFTSIISAHEQFVVLKTLGIGKTVLSPLITLPLLLIGYRSIAMVTVTVIISLMVDACYVFVVLGKLRQKFVFGKIEASLCKSILSFTSFIAINMIVDQINWNMGKVLLGRFKGTGEVAIYSVGYAIYNYYHMFSTAISNVFASRIHRIVVNTEGDLVKRRAVLTDIFTRVGRVQAIVLTLVATGVVFFGKPFIVNIWAGAEYERSYIVAVLLVLSASIALIQNLGIEIQRAINRHYFRSIVYFFMALINLGMTVILSRKHGAVGAAIGTACALIIANGIVMNIYYHKRCYINIIHFWKSIVRLLISTFPALVAGVLIRYVFDLDNILFFCIGVILYSMVYFAAIWFCGMNESEKALVLNFINKFLHRSR